MSECGHKPKCPSAVYTRWRCAHRTHVEDGVRAGIISAESARKHLQGYGLPLSAIRVVFKGEPPPLPKTERLW